MPATPSPYLMIYTTAQLTQSDIDRLEGTVLDSGDGGAGAAGEESAPTATLGTRLVGCITFFLFSLVAVYLNTILLIILTQSKSQLLKTPFYTIVWQFVICDYMQHFVQLFIAVPTTLAGHEVYDHGSVLFYAIATFETIAYNGTLYFNLLLALNRLIVFLFPFSPLTPMFEGPYLKVTIAMFWTLALGLVLAINLCGCRKNFSSKGFYFFHDCRDEAVGVRYVFLQITTVHGGTVLPLLMLIIYLTIFIAIRLFSQDYGIRKRKFSRRREYDILVQSFIICGVLATENIGFSAIPALQSRIPTHSQWGFYLNFLGNYFVLLNNTISPIILFSYNTEMKAHLRALLLYWSGRRMGTVSVVDGAGPLSQAPGATIAEQAGARKGPRGRVPGSSADSAPATSTMATPLFVVRNPASKAAHTFVNYSIGTKSAC